MEKINFKNSQGLNLVGNFYPADSRTVIIQVHGFTGDKSEWGRFDKAAEELNRMGYNILSFDFSGCGESDNTSLTVDKQIDDLQSAIKYVQGKGLNEIGLFGLSMGGLVSAKVYDEKIGAMVFWAPVTDKVKYPWDQRYSPEQIQELEEKGYFTKIRDKGVRRKFIIDKQLLKDRETVDQKSLLSKIKCPILIIHGDKDKNVPLEDSKNAMKYLPEGSKLEIVEGADHYVIGCLDKFIAPTTTWFKKHLPI